MMSILLRKDPVGNFRFWVEIDGINIAGFTEVSGLQIETEMEEYREGGVNSYVHYFPKATKYPRLVLTKGITKTSDLWDWYMDIVSGTITRKSGSVVLMSNAGYEMYRWNFFNAFPAKWVGPTLKSNSNEVAVEKLEIVHSGLKLVPGIGTWL